MKSKTSNQYRIDNLANRTQVNIEKGRETTQWQEMESKTGHMRAEFQNKTGNNKTQTQTMTLVI